MHAQVIPQKLRVGEWVKPGHANHMHAQVIPQKLRVGEWDAPGQADSRSCARSSDDSTEGSSCSKVGDGGRSWMLRSYTSESLSRQRVNGTDCS